MFIGNVVCINGSLLLQALARASHALNRHIIVEETLRREIKALRNGIEKANVEDLGSQNLKF